MNPKEKYSLSYYSQLDGLRCFAVLSVMVGHWIAWDTNISLIRHFPWQNGVILFFVLSGYLISNILFGLKEKIKANEVTFGRSLKIFYFRRLLRIFPAYYFLLFFLYFIDHNRTREIFPWLFTFTINILLCKEGVLLGSFNHLWSLAVEEQFYLFWPFIVLLIDQKHILKVILIFMAGSLLSRTFCYFFFSNWIVTDFFTLNLFFPLCLGSLLAYAHRYNKRISAFFNSNILLWMSILFYVSFYSIHKFLVKIDFMTMVLDANVFSVACAFVIFRASKNNFKYLANFVLSHEVTVYLGKISYGLYLYHLFVISIYWNYLAPRFQIDIHNIHTVWVFYFIIVFFMASFSYYVIERPFNGIKKRFEY
jgi:peptidoglycan/LPS O-acetylase OafA/YrhL